MTIHEIKTLSDSLLQNVKTVLFGKEDVIEKALICLFCGGHILLEDIPGTGKTTLAKALAKSVSCDFKRVQFTPDLLPSDLTGINFYNQKESEFVFKKGAVFTNILLADEINRATPRTQSSLLECMEEGQVSADGETYRLDQPFLVIATQNPIEIQGTFPLPEAQLDRFFMQLAVGYPSPTDEQDMLANLAQVHPVTRLAPVASGAEILAAQAFVRDVTVSPAVRQYLVAIVNATREHEKIRLGVSPRGTLALMRAAQAKAAISGRDFVLPDDVKAVAPDVLAHRIIGKGFSLSQSNTASRTLLSQIIKLVAVPIE